jgi:hypothetical protein
VRFSTCAKCERQLLTITYFTRALILGILGSQIEIERFVSIVSILMGFCQFWAWCKKLGLSCFAYQNWPNDPCVGFKEGSWDMVKFGEAKESP